MSEPASRGPVPDTSRTPQRGGPSGPPTVAPHVQRVIDNNPALARAIEVQQGKPPPEPERPPDPEVELAKPLDELPKWEPERTFTLATSVRRSDGKGVITYVRMRAPSGLDVLDVGGLPTRTRWDQAGMTVDMDAVRFKAWLQRLSIDVDMMTLERIPGRDMRAIYEWLINELNQSGN